MKDIDKLSNLELLNVFKFLDIIELLQITLVSKRFNKISSNKLLWKNLCMEKGYTSILTNNEVMFTWKQLALRSLPQNIKHNFKYHINQINIFDKCDRNMKLTFKSLTKPNTKIIGELKHDSKKIRTICNSKIQINNLSVVEISNINFNGTTDISCLKSFISYCIFNNLFQVNYCIWTEISNCTFTNDSVVRIIDNNHQKRNKLFINNCIFDSDFALTIKEYRCIEINNCEFNGTFPILIINFYQLIINNCKFNNEGDGYNISIKDEFIEETTKYCFFNNICLKNGLYVDGNIQLNFDYCNINEISINNEIEIFSGNSEIKLIVIHD